MTSSFAMAGWCSPDAEPYAQAVVRVRPAEGFALAACGGGGGAAQLMPATLLEPILVRAEAALAPPCAPADALRGLFDQIEAEVAALVNGWRYRGSGAAAVAMLAGPAEIHLAAVGLCRASRIAPGEIVPLTRDESLYEEALREGVEATDWLRTILVRRFGNDPLGLARPWQVMSVPSDPAATYLLSTAEVHNLIPPALLHSIIVEALAQGDLQAAAVQVWQRGHDWLAGQDLPAHCNMYQYRRAAALVLVRKLGGSSPSDAESFRV